jgi:hypothetical protein
MNPGVKALAADLQRIFGARLQSLVAYRGDDDGDGVHGVHTMALVEAIAFSDLAACAPRTADWRKAGASAPLILTKDEFLRTLDVFPLEYGGIIASHEVVVGEDVLAGLRVGDADLRRGIELQAKSHLIHLREGYIESGGSPKAVGQLISASAPALSSLLANLRRLDPAAAERAGITGELFREIATAADTTIADPSPLLARYLSAVERLWQEVDRWRA